MGRKDDDELCRAALAHDLGEQFQLGRWAPQPGERLGRWGSPYHEGTLFVF